MIRIARVAVLSGVLLVFFPLLASADCGDDCQSAYRNCLSVSDSRSCSVQLSTCTQTCVFHSERHGAIAYSESKRTYGYSYDYDRSADAKRAAVKYCRDSVKGGASDCRVVISFWNACGAIALAKDGSYGADWGPTKKEAAAKALNVCKPYGGRNCKVEEVVCSGASK